MLEFELRSDLIGFISHEIIARYQTCAWQDRARLILRIKRRWPKLKNIITDKWIECVQNANSWREWEKQISRI